MHDENDPIQILICDSNTKKSAALVEALKGLGYDNIELVNEDQRLQLAAAHVMPDLIILGDDFPESSALSLISQLRKQPMLGSVPLLMHRREQEPEEIRTFIQHGAAGTVTYPIEREQLFREMRNFFRIEVSPRVQHLMTQSPFFREFSADQVRALRKVAIARRYAAGETILQEGDPADTFYIVLEGRVEVILFQQGKRPVAIQIPAGEPFGELGVLHNTSRSAPCIAADETLVLEIGGHILHEFEDNIRLRLYRRLAQVLGDRLKEMNSVIDQVAVQRNTKAFQPSNLTPPEEASPPPLPSTEPAPVQEAEVRDSDEPPAEAETNPELFKSPLASPKAIAMEEIPGVRSQEDYDVLLRKVQLRTDFILNKVSSQMGDMVRNKLFGYWTGSKLAKHNPHKLWSAKSFHPKSTRLKNDLHMVVMCADGFDHYSEAYFGLPLTQKVIGLMDTGCSGTFLGSEQAIDRYLNAMSLEKAIKQDLEMAMTRLWMGNATIEFLTHSIEDIRPESLFVIIDTPDGATTQKVREAFPDHQIVTIVKGYGFDPEKSNSIFTLPEEQMRKDGVLVPKDDFKGKGFYEGETFFLPDFSHCFRDTDKLKESGYCFAPAAIIAGMGPDYAGITWGSKGGAEGAMRAARARYGLAGAQNQQQIADAISWADN